MGQFEIYEDDEFGGHCMTSFVLTLIGNFESAPLEADHVERIRQRLNTADKVDWLAEKEACDLFIESPLSAAAITGLARDTLAGMKIDSVCTAIAQRRKKLLVSDMDSTVIDQESIAELGDAIAHQPLATQRGRRICAWSLDPR